NESAILSGDFRVRKSRAIRYGIAGSITLNNYIAYEHARTYCYHLDRQGVPIPWSGLELSDGPWIHRERFILDAVPCPMGCLRATRRKCDSGLVLVLEHRRQRSHVHLLRFPARSDWNSRLSPKLTDLHSQFNADPETQVRFHRCRAVTKATRNKIANDQLKRSFLGSAA